MSLVKLKKGLADLRELGVKDALAGNLGLLTAVRVGGAYDFRDRPAAGGRIVIPVKGLLAQHLPVKVDLRIQLVHVGLP